MIEAGVDIITVSKILGHASIQMTMRYAHPTPDHMKQAVERLAEILDPARQKVDAHDRKAVCYRAQHLLHFQVIRTIRRFL